MTMAKGLTNGAQPMGAVATGERTTIRSRRGAGAISLHGYTYLGTARAALATLDITGTRIVRRAARRCLLISSTARGRPRAARRRRSRGYGMLAVIELHPAGGSGARGHLLQKKLFDTGLHLKTTGDSAIVAPPLIAEKQHVDRIVECLRKTLAGI
jgi:beta-alanine--pyruvate transaminase